MRKRRVGRRTPQRPQSPQDSGQNPLTQTSPTYSSKPRKPYAQQRRKPGFPQRSRETTCPEVHRSVRRRSGPGPTS